MNRRGFFNPPRPLLLLCLAAAASTATANLSAGARLGNPIGVSTYSFWHFDDKKVPNEECITMASEMGFDGVEILEAKMDRSEK
jgi:hypothetical protein